MNHKTDYHSDIQIKSLYYTKIKILFPYLIFIFHYSCHHSILLIIFFEWFLCRFLYIFRWFPSIIFKGTYVPFYQNLIVSHVVITLTAKPNVVNVSSAIFWADINYLPLDRLFSTSCTICDNRCPIHPQGLCNFLSVTNCVVPKQMNSKWLVYTIFLSFTLVYWMNLFSSLHYLFCFHKEFNQLPHLIVIIPHCFTCFFQLLWKFNTDFCHWPPLGITRWISNMYFGFCFVLLILYALSLENDRTQYPRRLRASWLDGGAPRPLPFIPPNMHFGMPVRFLLVSSIYVKSGDLSSRALNTVRRVFGDWKLQDSKVLLPDVIWPYIGFDNLIEQFCIPILVWVTSYTYTSCYPEDDILICKIFTFYGNISSRY